LSVATNWVSAAGNYIEIADVQLEEGDTATDFEYIPHDIQLLRCMRYYEVFSQGMIIGTNSVTSYMTASGFTFTVPKRTTPTITQLTTKLYCFSGLGNSGADLNLTNSGFRYVFVSDIAVGIIQVTGLSSTPPAESTYAIYTPRKFAADAEL
jgi:glutamate dehydrogenase/leucine dehydrogenase